VEVSDHPVLYRVRILYFQIYHFSPLVSYHQAIRLLTLYEAAPRRRLVCYLLKASCDCMGAPNLLQSPFVAPWLVDLLTSADASRERDVRGGTEEKVVRTFKPLRQIGPGVADVAQIQSHPIFMLSSQGFESRAAALHFLRAGISTKSLPDIAGWGILTGAACGYPALMQPSVLPRRSSIHYQVQDQSTPQCCRAMGNGAIGQLRSERQSRLRVPLPPPQPHVWMC
jgi:hypothetical protein